MFVLLEQKNKLRSYRRVCETKDFCDTIMASEDTKILKLNQYQKSDKASFIVYAGIGCLIKRMMDVKIILKVHS